MPPWAPNLQLGGWHWPRLSHPPENPPVRSPQWKSRWPKVRFVCRSGKPYEVDDLNRVSAFAAQHVLCLGGSGSSATPRSADSVVLTTLCALKCVPGSLGLASQGAVVADLNLLQNVKLAQHLGEAVEEVPPPLERRRICLGATIRRPDTVTAAVATPTATQLPTVSGSRHTLPSHS